MGATTTDRIGWEQPVLPTYELGDSGEFIITHYNSSKPFASFLPGIAGECGIPMWVFYVNRGQCVCSAGIQDKQHPIMEFLPANWAYMLTPTQGFRTFLKMRDHPDISFYEPFQNRLRDAHIRRTQRMIIEPSRLALEEVNETLGLEFRVEYQTVPDDDYAGLVRTLQIRNSSPHSVALDGLDGLPMIVPYGVDNNSLKHIRRLIEAFVEVVNLDQRAPFFRAKVEPADRPEVVKITRGNFYVGFESGESGARLVMPIVDPGRVFGNQTDHSYPQRFMTTPLEELSAGQILANRLPCAMGTFQTSIPAGGSFTYHSIVGHASSLEQLNRLLSVITGKGYIEKKARSNQRMTESLTQYNLICSSEPRLDGYARQNFLDNVLRGGVPITFRGDSGGTTLHLFSRKHGDLERDYNEFRITPTPYSQGNGNFRDVNQNRRSDLFFNPEVREENVKLFYDLLQLDGFNPLVIKEVRFSVESPELVRPILANHLIPEDTRTVEALLELPFTPGELLAAIKEQGIAVRPTMKDFMTDLLGICRKVQETDHGEGFWTDHWTYNLDLLENYLAFYPENRRLLLFETPTFGFFDSPYRVVPRDDRYVLWDGNTRQLNSVVFDKEKSLLIEKRTRNANRVHTKFGQGEVYRTLLVNKILCLIVNKIASLDPEGVGVEMEADKPNWYDALNGLPGLLGSSISETLELKRTIVFLMETFRLPEFRNEQWPVFIELKEFIDEIHGILRNRLSPLEFWDRSATVKERYRETTRLGISGKEEMVSSGDVQQFLSDAQSKLESGIEKAWEKEAGVLTTYFINKVVEYEEIKEAGSHGEVRIKRNAKGLPCFRARKFRQVRLPLFLEGPVHFLRSNPDHEQNRMLIKNIKKSGLYDPVLRMYKVNASLEHEPMEIGRARVFSPGWLENESIWLHMEYKYLLELLRKGFYEEFYEEMRGVCVPFFDPAVYGRSILENSSFIVSSAHPDESLHGNGFMARLSGASAEFIHMLMLMTVGANPFRLNARGELQLCLEPALPGWLFTEQARTIHLHNESGSDVVEVPANSFTFMFLGKVLMTYHNRDRKDTFGVDGLRPVSWRMEDHDGKCETVTGRHLNGAWALRLRERKLRWIEIELG